MSELSEAVKLKLSQAIEEWADENIIGRPEILMFAVLSTMEKTLLEQQEKIDAAFPRNKQ